MFVAQRRIRRLVRFDHRNCKPATWSDMGHRLSNGLPERYSNFPSAYAGAADPHQCRRPMHAQCQKRPGADARKYEAAGAGGYEEGSGVSRSTERLANVGAQLICAPAAPQIGGATSLLRYSGAGATRQQLLGQERASKLAIPRKQLRIAAGTGRHKYSSRRSTTNRSQ